MIVTVEYDMIVVVKIYSCITGNYFIAFTFCKLALYFALKVQCLYVRVAYSKVCFMSAMLN